MNTWKAGQPVQLRSKRFHIRSLTGDDASQRLLGWLNDPQLTYYLGGIKRIAGLKELAGVIKKHDNRRSFMLGVFHQDSLVGVQWVEIAAKDRNARTHHLFGEKALWGTDAGLEVRAAVMNWLFRAGAMRIEGWPMAECRSAIYGYKKQGFTFEGVLKSAMIHMDGNRHDILMFRMLRDEWKALQEQGDPDKAKQKDPPNSSAVTG